MSLQNKHVVRTQQGWAYMPACCCQTLSQANSVMYFLQLPSIQAGAPKIKTQCRTAAKNASSGEIGHTLPLASVQTSSGSTSLSAAVTRAYTRSPTCRSLQVHSGFLALLFTRGPTCKQLLTRKVTTCIEAVAAQIFSWTQNVTDAVSAPSSESYVWAQKHGWF